jgi:iron complex transport system ATP-binding protein
VIEVTNLTFGYSKERNILESLTFTAQKGEIINILGANGCGKSTLIKAMLGFFRLKEGVIKYNGIDINKIKRRDMARLTSYVPQFHMGAFAYSVLDVVLMGRASFGGLGYSERDYGMASEALRKVGLLKFAERSYLHLSGGERQLVIIARALAQGSEFFLMDEPVAGLDYGNQYRLLSIIGQLANEGRAIILSTHHPEHALFLGGRSVLIKDGRIIGNGTSRNIVNSKSVSELYDISETFLEQFSKIQLN